MAVTSKSLLVKFTYQLHSLWVDVSTNLALQHGVRSFNFYFFHHKLLVFFAFKVAHVEFAGSRLKKEIDETERAVRKNAKN